MEGERKLFAYDNVRRRNALVENSVGGNGSAELEVTLVAELLLGEG